MMAYVPNASTKFLFAILKQCDLRHIDWDEVAQDSHLEKPISNGHAARMRYSRLRTTIQGPGKPKAVASKPAEGRVSKSKKATTPKPPAASATTQARASPAETIPPQLDMSAAVLVKQEPGVMPTPVLDHAHRFMTPCSDEMFPQTPHLDFGSRLQTPEVANGPSLFGIGMPEPEECDHPEEFKQFNDAMGHVHHDHHDHAPYMAYNVPWGANGNLQMPYNSVPNSHKTYNQMGDIDLTKFIPPQLPYQQPFNGNPFVHVKHECTD